MGGEQEFSATAVATVIPPTDEDTSTESDN